MLLTALATADDTAHERGRELARDGLAAYKKRDYDEAIKLFSEAVEHYPAGQVLRMLGYSHLALEHWLEAADSLDRSLQTELKPLPENMHEEVNGYLSDARSHIATIEVTSSIDGAEVSIDGGPWHALPLRRQPLVEGKHTLVVNAEEHLSVERTVRLKGGKFLDFEIDPKPIPDETPAPVTPPSKQQDGAGGPQRAIGLVAAAAGLLAAGSGIGPLVYAQARVESVNDATAAHRNAYGPGCGSGSASQACRFDALVIDREAQHLRGVRATGIGLLVGGSVLAGVGISVYLLAPSNKGQENASLSCRPWPLGVGCSGRF